MSEDQIRSRYEALTVPEFRSAIPPHLLGKLNDQERYLVETLSKMEQQNGWLIVASVKANAAIIDLDTRQTRVEQWKDRLTSKWALVVAFGAIVLPVAAKSIFDFLVKKIP